MLGKFSEVLGDVLFTLGAIFKTEASSYTDIETCEDDQYTFVRSDGTLVTILRVHGVQKLLGPHELAIHYAHIKKRLEIALGRSGHSVQVVMKRNPDGTDREIEQILRPARTTAKRLNMDMNWILDAKKDALLSFCASEACWLAISTNYDVFSKSEIQSFNKERGEMMKSTPRGKDAQNMTPSARGLYSNHVSLVNDMLEGFRSFGVVIDPLDAHEALHQIRKEVDPDFTSDSWRALLPGDPLPAKNPDTGYEDLSQILYPKISSQLFPRGASEIINHRWIEIGDQIHAPMVMSLPPQNVESFQSLLGSLMDANIPYRISFDLTPDGLNGFGLKSTLAAVLHITSSNNKQFNAAYDGLRRWALDGGEVIGFRVCADTWASADDLALIRTRSSRLAQSIQGWGNCDTRDMIGDPLMGFSATLPGANRVNPAPSCAAPLENIVPMLPLTRPASPWREGAMPFRTPDGKLMAYQPGSSLQTASVTLGFAPMGQGKSVLLNAHNLSLCLREGLERLPYISILDIGPSSSGLISLIQQSLPKDKQHLAAYHRLKMTHDYAINPFDLPLGLKEPMPDHYAMLVNLLVTLCTEPGETKPTAGGVDGIASSIVKLVYDVYSPSRTPKRFDKHQNPEIAQKIEGLGILVDRNTTWWEIRDDLFDRGEYELALIAQRYAVPVLGDCAAVVRDASITNIYKGEVATRETVTDYVWRMLTEAINEFPILAQPTRFDLGNARVVSLDLDEVCPKGSAKAEKQTGVMYMLGRYVLAQRYYFGKDALPFFDDRYRPFQVRRVAETATDPKFLCLDEFHRTEGVEGIRSQVVRDIREGRKWGIGVILVSQNVDDFDEIMIELSSTRFILGANTPSDAKKICKKFELADSAYDIILNRILKPGRKGSGVYCSARTEIGNAEMQLYLTLGLTEVWAFDSTAENRTIRDYLYEKVGARKALEMLCKYFPNGSVVKAYEKRRAEMDAEGISKDKTLIEIMADEILEQEMALH